MKHRVISLLLAIVLAVLLIPTPASAAATEAADIQQQIRSTYLTALRRSGRKSFNGFCGSMVNWQTCLLGIDERVYGCDGKNEYDMYRDLGTTTGGYQVKCYPASRYTLRSALNAITSNGTVDAYNILVGFQRTNTSEGSVYGHALLIHAVLDGVVYFAECYNASIGGKYWAEGTAISCSIDTFCDYYDRWTVFDGIAYFGVKTYADVCEKFPSSMYAMVKEDLAVYAEPSDPGIYEAEKTGENLVAGEMVKVSGLLKTPGGAYWYQLEGNGSPGFVEAQKLVFSADCYEDVQITGLKVPTALRRRSGFVLRGNVSSQSSQIQAVLVSVYSLERDMDMPVFSCQLETDGQSVSLNNRQMDNTMAFRKLEKGTYRISITAKVESYVLENGEPVSQIRTLQLWNSELQIITDWGKYATITLDGNGGDAELDQLVVAEGQAIGALPHAAREGYMLSGWSMDPEGKQPFTTGTAFNENTTLYAQWEKGIALRSGWINAQQGWSYYANGTPVQGWFTSNGLKFYQNSDGTRAKGWLTVEGSLRYFNAAGVLLSGWQEIDGNRYYFNENGGSSTGWVTIGTDCYYFAEDGKMQTEWIQENGNHYYLLQCGNKATGSVAIDGTSCHFDNNGVLQFVQQLTGQSSCYVVFDRQAAEKYINPAQRLLLG